MSESTIRRFLAPAESPSSMDARASPPNRSDPLADGLRVEAALRQFFMALVRQSRRYSPNRPPSLGEVVAKRFEWPKLASVTPRRALATRIFLRPLHPKRAV